MPKIFLFLLEMRYKKKFCISSALLSEKKTFWSKKSKQEVNSRIYSALATQWKFMIEGLCVEIRLLLWFNARLACHSVDLVALNFPKWDLISLSASFGMKIKSLSLP